MKKKTNEQFIEELKLKNPYVFTNHAYVNAVTKLEFHCIHNAEHIWMADPHHVLRGRGCPYCASQKAFKTQQLKNMKQNKSSLLCNHNPELVLCLKNQEDAMMYTYASHKEILWKCPDCGYEFFHRIADFACQNRHFSCPSCLKSDSYPNRFMFSLLTQLKIPFIKEYSPDWIKPKRYDFYFQVNEKSYIVEMDGYFHSLDEGIKNDAYKDKLAIAHNIEIIRIDCIYRNVGNREEHIKNAICSSILADLLPLDTVDFSLCDKQAYEKIYIIICQLWDLGMGVAEICSKLCLSDTTVIKYLKHGEKHKLCTYNHEKQKTINEIKRCRTASIINGQAVMCKETKEVFPSMAIASKYYKCAVGEYFRYNRSYAGILPDGTKLTWKKISTKKYLKLRTQGALDEGSFFYAKN